MNQKIVKNIYNGLILTALLAILLITPVTAANTVIQNVTLPIPEVIGISINPTNITFDFNGLGNYAKTGNFTLQNTGNVYECFLVQLTDDFKSNSNQLNQNEIQYSIQHITSGLYLSIIKQFQMGITDYLAPNAICSTHQRIFVPAGAPQGIYTAKVTYIAMKNPQG